MKISTSNQIGQTLVETVVGIFVLTVGISTAIGLANSVFISTASAVKQLQAVGLAREGVEAVFSMRATNWLRSPLGTCYDYQAPNSQTGAACRNLWRDPANGSGTTSDGVYDMRGAAAPGRAYTLRTDYTAVDTADYWQFTYQPGATPDYRLYYDSTAATGVLYTTNSGVGQPSDYYRQIVIEEDTSVPYNQNVGPRLKVYSRVWWVDRGCKPSTTWPTSGNCRIEFVTYLTNWRNF